MTFLEVVFATTILAMIVSVMFGSIGFMLGRQRVEQRSLGAAELANRLMLQYLDDFTSMPDQNLPIAYGPDRYRWDLERKWLRLEPAEPAHKTRTGTLDRGGSLIEKSKLITIRVWLGEESGGSFVADASVPKASVSRIVYPFLAGRNPDSWTNAQGNDEYMRILREEMGVGGGGANVGGFGGKAGTAAPRTPGTPARTTTSGKTASDGGKR